MQILVKNLLLTGMPGSGKTTLIKKILEDLKIKAKGFYTSEIREKGVRTGFWVSDFSGRKEILASVYLEAGPRVGKYRVNLEGFEKIALPALRDLKEAEILVIDEIGKMELFSQSFQDLLLKLLDFGPPVLGTILKASHPFGDHVKQRSDVRLFWITPANREAVYDLVSLELKNLLKRS